MQSEKKIGSVSERNSSKKSTKKTDLTLELEYRERNNCRILCLKTDPRDPDFLLDKLPDDAHVLFVFPHVTQQNLIPTPANNSVFTSIITDLTNK